MQSNLGGDFKEFQSAYVAVGTDLFDQQEGSLRKLTQTAAPDCRWSAAIVALINFR